MYTRLAFAGSSVAIALALLPGGCARGTDSDLFNEEYGYGGEGGGDEGNGEGGSSSSSTSHSGSTTTTGNPPGCGDASCEGDETCTTCPADCGPCAACGDAVCNDTETCGSCPADCGPCGPVCGDAKCDAGETCQTCQADCGPCGPTCGDGKCDLGESCQSCQLDCGPCGGACAHDLCQSGDALMDGCDPCVTQVCQIDSFCCDTLWDEVCVGEVESVCGKSCGGAGGCAHDPCSAGEALDPACDACVATVCNVDPFCCTNSWDSLCVDEVTTECGQSC